jgi:hypothetical protein
MNMVDSETSEIAVGRLGVVEDYWKLQHKAAIAPSSNHVDLTVRKAELIYGCLISRAVLRASCDSSSHANINMASY